MGRMKQLDWTGFLELSLEICEKLTEANVGNNGTESMSLSQRFRYELLLFGLFLADADGCLDEAEVALICRALSLDTSREELARKKREAGRELDFTAHFPTVLKYAVLADAGKRLQPDPYFGQKAQVFYDTFRLFGQELLALHKNEADNATLSRFTASMEKMEGFLKEYGVWYAGIQKYFRPVTSKERNNATINGVNAEKSGSAESTENTKNTENAESTENAGSAGSAENTGNAEKSGSAENTGNTEKPRSTENTEKQTVSFGQERLEELLEELNSLTGLTQVKHQIQTLTNLLQVQALRQEMGLKTSALSKHMVFIGNPGTGKTTVARLLAEIYRCLGVLETGQLIETDRSGLVCGFIGQTATRVQEVVEQAVGGILFIDEAYALTVGRGEGDFGREAVDTLLKAMEDRREELIVIVAGYPREMEEFLSSNPGLRSRFNQYIMFEDYSAQELFSILQSMLKKQEYLLSPEAEEKAKALLEQCVAEKTENFANAREVRNRMEKAISAQAGRILREKEQYANKPEQERRKFLSTIEAVDLSEW